MTNKRLRYASLSLATLLLLQPPAAAAMTKGEAAGTGIGTTFGTAFLAIGGFFLYKKFKSVKSPTEPSADLLTDTPLDEKDIINADNGSVSLLTNDGGNAENTGGGGAGNHGLGANDDILGGDNAFNTGENSQNDNVKSNSAGRLEVNSTGNAVPDSQDTENCDGTTGGSGSNSQGSPQNFDENSGSSHRLDADPKSTETPEGAGNFSSADNTVNQDDVSSIKGGDDVDNGFGSNSQGSPQNFDENSGSSHFPGANSKSAETQKDIDDDVENTDGDNASNNSLGDSDNLNNKSDSNSYKNSQDIITGEESNIYSGVTPNSDGIIRSASNSSLNSQNDEFSVSKTQDGQNSDLFSTLQITGDSPVPLSDDNKSDDNNQFLLEEEEIQDDSQGEVMVPEGLGNQSDEADPNLSAPFSPNAVEEIVNSAPAPIQGGKAKSDEDPNNNSGNPALGLPAAASTTKPELTENWKGTVDGKSIDLAWIKEVIPESDPLSQNFPNDLTTNSDYKIRKKVAIALLSNERFMQEYQALPEIQGFRATQAALKDDKVYGDYLNKAVFKEKHRKAIFDACNNLQVNQNLAAVYIGKRDRAYVAADFHGDIQFAVCQLREFFNTADDKSVFIVAGDFSDRGSGWPELAALLLTLQVLLPENIFLIEGNHEYMVNYGSESQYHFHKDPLYGEGEDGEQIGLRVHLPLHCVVDIGPKRVVSCHAALNENFVLPQILRKKYDQGTDDNIKKEGKQEVALSNKVTKACVTDDIEFASLNTGGRGGETKFINVEDIVRLLQNSGCDILVKGHQHGANFYKNDHIGVAQILSSFNYCDSNTTPTFVEINQNGAFMVFCFGSKSVNEKNEVTFDLKTGRLPFDSITPNILKGCQADAEAGNSDYKSTLIGPPDSRPLELSDSDIQITETIAQIFEKADKQAAASKIMNQNNDDE